MFARTLAAGLVSGVPAGLVMAAWLRVTGASNGAGNAGAGLALHLACSVLFAAFFSWLVRPKVPAPDLLAWSALYGVGLFVLMQYGISPLAQPALYAAIAPQPWDLFLSYLIYGGVTGCLLAAWRSRRRILRSRR